MPVPLVADLRGVVLHDQNGIPIDSTLRGDGKNALAVDTGGGGGGGGGPVTAVTQTPVTVQNAPLAASGSATSGSKDVTNFESFGVSAFVKSIAGKPLTAHLLVEISLDGATFDTLENIPLNNPALASSADINRVYSTTRKFYRATLVNDDAVNALAESRFGVMLKPI